MPKNDKTADANEVMVQLATRVPKTLHKAVKTHCVTNDVSVMDYVVQCLEAGLTAGKAKRKAS